MLRLELRRKLELAVLWVLHGTSDLHVCTGARLLLQGFHVYIGELGI